jgi:hypothetical protein
MDGIDLSKIVLNGAKPEYVYNYTYGGSEKQIKVKYEIAGYTLSPASSTLRFKSNQVVTEMDFGGSRNLTLYVAWDSEHILQFVSDPFHYAPG